MQANFQPAAHSYALYGREDRFGAAAHRPDQLVAIVDPCLHLIRSRLGEDRQIGPRAHVAVDGCAKHDDADAFVRLKRVIGGAYFGQHDPIRCVEWRAVVSEPANMVDDFGLDGFETGEFCRHGAMLGRKGGLGQ